MAVPTAPSVLLLHCCTPPTACTHSALPCSILYQRGIYPQETFQQKKHYGLSMMMTKDDGLLAYLSNVTKQMTGVLITIHECCMGTPQPNVGHDAAPAATVNGSFKSNAACIPNSTCFRAPCGTVHLHLFCPCTALCYFRHHTSDWLEKGLLQRLVLVVTSAYSGEVLERWTFEVQTDAEVLAGG